MIKKNWNWWYENHWEISKLHQPVFNYGTYSRQWIYFLGLFWRVRCRFKKKQIVSSTCRLRRLCRQFFPHSVYDILCDALQFFCKRKWFSLHKWLADHRNIWVCIVLVLGKCVHSSACIYQTLMKKKTKKFNINSSGWPVLVYIHCLDGCFLRRPKHVA